MGLGLVEGGEGLKDMKVLIRQRGNGEVYAERERLWNGQAFLHFDCFCASANQSIEEEDREGERHSSFLEALLENIFFHIRAAGTDHDVADGVI